MSTYILWYIHITEWPRGHSGSCLSPRGVITVFLTHVLCRTFHPGASFILKPQVWISWSPSSVSLFLPPPVWKPPVSSLYECFCFVMCVHLLCSFKISLCLACVTQRNSLQVCPRCCEWQDRILFHGRAVTHCAHVPHLFIVSLLVDTWVASMSGCCKQCRGAPGALRPFQISTSVLFGKMPRSGISG